MFNPIGNLPDVSFSISRFSSDGIIVRWSDAPPSTLGSLRDRVDEAIDRVAAQHPVLRLDREVNLFCEAPAELVGSIRWAERSRRGLLAYALEHEASSIAGDTRDALNAFDQTVRPVVPTKAVFDSLAAEGDGHVRRCLRLERLVRGGVLGDEEARAFVAAYFRQHAVPATRVDVAAYGAGVGGVLLSFASAVNSQCDVGRGGAALLAPVGIDQALLAAMKRAGGSTEIVDDLTGPVLAEWLRRSRSEGARAVVVPMVNPLTGHVVTRRRARDLAGVVLRHNMDSPNRPVSVFSDASGMGSCHSEVVELDTQPIGGTTGADIGAPSLGCMSSWTLDVVSPCMTLPSSRVAFVVTQNRWLRGAVNDWSMTYGHANTRPLDELAAAAALCLTPQRWFDEANDHTADNLRLLREAVVRFNSAECGFDGLSVENHVDGGWHTAVRFDRRLFPFPVDSSLDVFAWLLKYHCAVSGSTRVALLPGELFSWSLNPGTVEPHFVLRVNLSAPTEDFTDFLWQLGQASSALWQQAWKACQRGVDPRHSG